MSTRNEYNLILLSSKLNDFIVTIVIVFSCAIFVKIDEQKITINRYSFVFTGEVVRVCLFGRIVFAIFYSLLLRALFYTNCKKSIQIPSSQQSTCFAKHLIDFSFIN